MKEHEGQTNMKVESQQDATSNCVHDDQCPGCVRNNQCSINIAECPDCIDCQLTVQCYEHYCSNCGRYEPIDSDTGWCGNTKVHADNWCQSWR